VGHLQITANAFCQNCHPATGDITPGIFPVATVHQGVARAQEAALYQGGSNGYAIDASYDRDTELLTVDFSVTRDGQKMILQSDPLWSNGARLALVAGWSTEDYTNEESGRTPAQPLSINALDVGGAVTDLGGGNYRSVIDLADVGFGNVTVGLEGHPEGDLFGDGNYVRIPVRDVWATVNVERRETVMARRQVIDIAKCNACHDSSGAGLSLHGDNRSSEMQVCTLCHNPDATDISRRPADPADAIDGKREESIDMKRLIHGIHAGADRESGLVVYGFGGTAHDFSTVEFIGNLRNCLTCHLPGTYGVANAAETLASTIDTGADLADPLDDLNISPITSACSSCHDDVVARNHMLLGGGSFAVLDENVVVPEPGLAISLLMGCGALGLMARRRRESTD
jgi:OmcA/MtrC family decaheme c-type cytochrome